MPIDMHKDPPARMVVLAALIPGKEVKTKWK
jgi:hypothetical protein